MELIYTDFHTQIVFAGVIGSQLVTVDEDGDVRLCASRQKASYTLSCGEKVQKVVATHRFVAVLCDMCIYVYTLPHMSFCRMLREGGTTMLNCCVDEQGFLYVLLSRDGSKFVRRYDPVLEAYDEDELLFDTSSTDVNPRDPTSFCVLCGVLYVQQTAYKVMNTS